MAFLSFTDGSYVSIPSPLGKIKSMTKGTTTAHTEGERDTERREREREEGRGCFLKGERVSLSALCQELTHCVPDASMAVTLSSPKSVPS